MTEERERERADMWFHKWSETDIALKAANAKLACVEADAEQWRLSALDNMTRVAELERALGASGVVIVSPESSV